MKNNLTAKLKDLPNSPGVYFHKNKKGQIIYVGKAANLKNRVRQYFQAGRQSDAKTDLLVSEIADVDWMVVPSEAEALFLEAELIKRYLPKYNILLRDDKSSIYIRINLKDIAPSVTITRRPQDDGASYFGPFLQAWAVTKALRYLRRAFPYSTHLTLPSRVCLDYHLGLCPGPETAAYSRGNYLSDLKKLILFMEGKSPKVVKALETEMKAAAKSQNYELAALLRNQMNAIKALKMQIIFGDRESLDLSKDHALADLTNLLGLKQPPHRIEGYDISHLQATDTVASMVVFANGAPAKAGYRKFKMRLTGNDDYAHMHEVVQRRLSKKNLQAWGTPDLMLIDGGKGQLGVAISARDGLGLKIPVIGLAKKFEELVIYKPGSEINLEILRALGGSVNQQTTDYLIINLPKTSHIIKLLQRVRDESHRFALSYHTALKTKRQRRSQIDTIPGIGPASKKRLLKQFGSLKALAAASTVDVAKVVGPAKARIISQYFVEHQ